MMNDMQTSASMFSVKVFVTVRSDCVDRISTDGVPLRFLDVSAL